MFRPPERRGERRQHRVREETMTMIGTAGKKRALSLCLSLSACKVFCVGKFEFYVSVLQASFLECVCYMFRARMFYTIELELLLF